MTRSVPGKPVEILLVEDNPADVRMTREALKVAGVLHHLHVVEDGLDAIAFLYQGRQYGGVPLPDLILLDLNIPRVNGHEVLLEIKTNDRLKHIPVVVLTSSKAGRDVRKSYQRSADYVVIKPAGLDAFVQVIKSIKTVAARRPAPRQSFE